MNTFEEYSIGDYIITITTGGNHTTHADCKQTYTEKGKLLKIKEFTNSKWGVCAICEDGYVIYLQSAKYVRLATYKECKHLKSTYFIY